jgi:hypothetical protein
MTFEQEELMRRAVFSSAALALITSVAFAQAPSMGQEKQQAPQDQPQGRTSAPDHTVPPTGEAQPKAPIADQAKPAAVGPSQANTASSVPGNNGPIGATGQTMPSTISAENAKLDKLTTTAHQFPLTEEQKKLIATRIASAPKAQGTGDLSNVHVADFLPTATPSQDFSPDIMSEIPAAKQYKYVKLDKRVLIVDPPNGTVVGEIAN